MEEGHVWEGKRWREGRDGREKRDEMEVWLWMANATSRCEATAWAGVWGLLGEY